MGIVLLSCAHEKALGESFAGLKRFFRPLPHHGGGLFLIRLGLRLYEKKARKTIMIIIMKPQATEEQIGSLCHDLSRQGMQVQRNAGVDCTVLGVLGDVARLDPHDFLIQPGVERVMPVSEPFKKANREIPSDGQRHRLQRREGRRAQAGAVRRPVLGRELRPDYRYGAQGARQAAQTSCAAARISRARRPMRSRD